MVKNFIEVLKRQFDEVDSATDQFYQNGISRASMKSLIRVMDKIWAAIAYFERNQDLLFYERKQELLSEISELDL